MRFPVLAINRLDVNREFVRELQAGEIDADAIGVGPRSIKRLHATNAAKQMPSDPGVESIF